MYIPSDEKGKRKKNLNAGAKQMDKHLLYQSLEESDEGVDEAMWVRTSEH